MTADFLPSADWQHLRLRAELMRAARAFFDERGFVEVDTPVLSTDTVVDRHLDPLSVTLPHDPRQPERGRKLWLQTSPEFAMKRIMVAGADAIYQLAHAFRAAEQGPRHNPEFTLLEWYRAGDDLAAAMQLTDQLCQRLLNTPPAERVTYAEAFAEHAGVDPHQADVARLTAAVRHYGIDIPLGIDASDRDAWLDLLLIDRVEPQLGQAAPTLLYNYPATQAALARVEGNPPVARRFELYVQGIELANGYHELLDPEELLARNQTANNARATDGKLELPNESHLLAAMRAGLPPCSGVALGFDRAVMLAAGAKTIDQVLAFPIDRA